MSGISKSHLLQGSSPVKSASKIARTQSVGSCNSQGVTTSTAAKSPRGKFAAATAAAAAALIPGSSPTNSTSRSAALLAAQSPFSSRLSREHQRRALPIKGPDFVAAISTAFVKLVQLQPGQMLMGVEMDGVMPQDYPPRLAKVRTNLPGKYLRVNVGRELGEMLENSDMVHQGCRMLDNGTLILVMVKAPRRVTPQKSMGSKRLFAPDDLDAEGEDQLASETADELAFQIPAGSGAVAGNGAQAPALPASSGASIFQKARASHALAPPATVARRLHRRAAAASVVVSGMEGDAAVQAAPVPRSMRAPNGIALAAGGPPQMRASLHSAPARPRSTPRTRSGDSAQGFSAMGPTVSACAAVAAVAWPLQPNPVVPNQAATPVHSRHSGLASVPLLQPPALSLPLDDSTGFRQGKKSAVPAGGAAGTQAADTQAADSQETTRGGADTSDTESEALSAAVSRLSVRSGDWKPLEVLRSGDDFHYKRYLISVAFNKLGSCTRASEATCEALNVIIRGFNVDQTNNFFASTYADMCEKYIAGDNNALSKMIQVFIHEHV